MYDQKIIDCENELIDLIKSEMATLVKLKAKETYTPSPLKTFHQQELEIKRSLFKGFSQYLERIKSGCTHLLEENIPGLKKNLQDEILELTKQSTLVIASGETLQDKLNIADQTFLLCYEQGQQFFQQKNYLAASDIFLFLSTLNPLVPSVWIALGRAEECNKQEESALLAYLMGLELNPEELSPLFDCLRCLKYLKRIDEANSLLDKALEYLKKHPESADLKNQILLEKSKL